MLSAAGFAATTLVGACPVEGLDPLTTTGYAFLLGALALALAPVAAAVDGLGLPPTIGALALATASAAPLGDRLGPGGLVGAALVGVAVVLITARLPRGRARARPPGPNLSRRGVH